MIPSLDRVIEHVLTIVYGYTGIHFVLDESVGIMKGQIQQSNNISCRTAYWKSLPVKINGGPLGLVAREVRIHITMEITFDEDEENSCNSEDHVVTNPNGDFTVSVAFIFVRHDGVGETAMNRHIQFRGPYFRRFD